MKPLLKWGLFLYVLLIGWLNVRERVQMHPDEVYSVMLAQCNPAYCKGIEPGTYTGERLQRELIAAHPVSEDIASLYADNRDVPHASLYYMTLRIVLGDTMQWDPVRIVRTGGLLNLFFLAVAYLMLWSLMSRLTRGSPWLTAACVAMAMLGPGTLECGALLREYQLSMLGIVWYAYALFLLFEKPEMSGRQLCISGISLSFSAALCLSTGYLNSFCLLLLPLGCIAALLAEKAPRRHVSRFTVTALSAGFCSLLIARVMYAGFFNFLTHGSVHKSRAFGSIDGVFDAAFIRDIVGEGFTLPLLIFLALLLAVGIYCRRAKFRDACRPSAGRNYMIVMLICGALSIFAVQYCSLLRNARYSYPYLPLLCGVVPLCVSWMRGQWRILCSVMILLYSMFSAACFSPRSDYGWDNMRRLLNNGATFHNLNPNELPLLYPVLNPHAYYTVESDSSPLVYGAAPVIVHYAKPKEPPTHRVIRLSGSLRLVKPCEKHKAE